MLFILQLSSHNPLHTVQYHGSQVSFYNFFSYRYHPRNILNFAPTRAATTVLSLFDPSSIPQGQGKQQVAITITGSLRQRKTTATGNTAVSTSLYTFWFHIVPKAFRIPPLDRSVYCNVFLSENGQSTQT